jgi:hypothetical protein
VEVQGLDGEWVLDGPLEIPAELFQAADLARPVELGHRFDLVLSLEVAEHLPAESATTFVRSLVGLGPAVVFSAAIPRQGGVGRLNEQWTDYWAALFKLQGYEVIDCLRGPIWADERVEWWYAQNMLLFVRPDQVFPHPLLEAAREWTEPNRLNLVHPRGYLARVGEMAGGR